MDHSPGKNTNSQRHDRSLKGVIEEKDREDDADIEEDWGEGRGEEMSKGVQDSHTKGEEPHEKEVREDNLV